MQVLEVARDLGVSPDTVRYYTRIGLLDPARDSANGYKNFGRGDCNRLRFILSARHLGFSVNDIQQILAHADQGESPCGLVRKLIEDRLEEVSRRFDDIARLKHRMEVALSAWRTEPDQAPSGDMICHLIESFAENPDQPAQQNDGWQH